MAKLIILDDAKTLGFKAHQFDLDEGAVFDAWLQAQIDQTEGLLIEFTKVGFNGDATGATYDPRLKAGGLLSIESELWARRAATIDASSSLNRRDSDISDSAHAYVINAKETMVRASAMLRGLVDEDAPFYGESSGGIAVGYASTDHFSEATV